MSQSAVDVLLFRLGPHRLAVELQLVSSVLDPDEAQGLERIDPRPRLLDVDGDPGQLDELEDARVGLLDLHGPPTVVLLGEILGAESIESTDLIAVDDWIAGWLPDVVEPACIRIDQKVVWLLNLDKLNRVSSP